MSLKQIKTLYIKFRDSLSYKVTLCLKHTNTYTHTQTHIPPKQQPHIIIMIIIMIIIINYLKLFKSNSLGRKFLSTNRQFDRSSKLALISE